jgi:hypothetical protein
MAQTVDPEWARDVLQWWIKAGQKALANGRSNAREFEFCTAGPLTDEMLGRELQTRTVIKTVPVGEGPGPCRSRSGRHPTTTRPHPRPAAPRAVIQLVLSRFVDVERGPTRGATLRSW